MRAPVWIVIPILAAGCAGGGAGEHAARSGSQQRGRQGPAPARQKPATPATPRRHRTAPKTSPKSATATHARHPAKSKPKPVPRPPTAQHGPPWGSDGTSLVAHVRLRQIAVYRSPLAKRPLLTLARRDVQGTPRVFLVRARWRDWVHVYLPTRPNGRLGWVRQGDVRLYNDRYRLVVRLGLHRLQLWDGGRVAANYPVAVGTPSTPTPRGIYYIVELLQPPDPGGTYGPFSFGLSAHSNVLQTFSGGDGRVGLHGTDEPGLIGSSVSHGCIRIRNEAVRRLARILPLGTPVFIRS